MKKNRIIAALLMCLILTSLVGCGNKQTPPPASDTVIAETVGSTANVTSATDISDDITAATTESKVSESSTAEKEEETRPTESTTPTATSTSAESTQKPSQATKPTENPPKTTEPPETTADTQETAKPTETPTVKPTEPPVTESAETTVPETTPTETKPAATETKPIEPAETQPPAETEPQGFTKADHDRIIAEVKAYAESYTAKGYTYIWKADMEFSEDVGYMGTPRIARDGVDGVIRTLKYHIDLIYKTTTDPSNGITCDEMTYRVMQIDLDGEIAFVVVYGG